MTFRAYPAKADEVREVLGERTYFTLYNALAVAKDDKVLGLCGLVWHQGRKYIFSEIKEEGFRYPKQILKNAREYLKTLPPGVYYAVADKRHGTACRFLEKLGFTEEMDSYRLEIE